MKKLLCLILTALMILTLAVSSAALKISVLNAPDGFGDTDGSGVVNNKDITVLFRYLSENSGGKFVADYDINYDLSLNNKDLTTLFRFISGYDVEINEPTPAENFTVSKVIDDYMVIQRNEEIRLWGFADESENGKTVYAEFSGLTGECRISDGHWYMVLNGTLEANTTGETMRVYGADNVEYIYDDILVGDVYWVVGQSNIHYSVSDMNKEALVCEEAKNIEINNKVKIRLNRNYFKSDFSSLTQGTTDVEEDVIHNRGWQYPGNNGALRFSALGYYTAMHIYNALDREVPIGLIEFDGNGLALHAFLPNEVADALHVDTLQADGTYTAAGSNPHASRFMYNHYMYAFQNLPICGIIWYQGESDLNDDNGNNVLYAQRFTALINYLRDKHNMKNHDYPVYITEFPAVFIQFDWTTVRMTMGSIPNLLTNAHMYSSSDFWKTRDYNNPLHPPIKWEQSLRLAPIILANSYGIGELEDVESPTAKSAALSDDGLTVNIEFRNVGGGLRYEGDALIGIKIRTGNSDEWVDPASVEITASDTVTVTSETPIREVAYNTDKGNTFPENISLCSGTGVPSCAFRYVFN